MKYLVTSGCSFTAYERCWPYRLVEQLGKINYTLINDAEGSSGNAMIHRRIIYQVGKLLAQGIDKDDILVGISTSGNSKNVINAMIEAKKKEMICIGFSGSSGGKMKNYSDILINVPSNNTPRIQEAHIMIGHIICEFVEKKLFKNENIK